METPPLCMKAAIHELRVVQGAEKLPRRRGFILGRGLMLPLPAHDRSTTFLCVFFFFFLGGGGGGGDGDGGYFLA